MIGFLIRWFVNILALMVVLHTMQGIRADSFEATVFAAVSLGLVNAFLRPAILLLTLPFNVLSLGLFTLFINAGLFYLVSKIVPGFYVANFSNAFWGALIFAVVSFMLNFFIGVADGMKNSRVNFRFYTNQGFKRHKKYTDAIDVDATSDGPDIKKRQLP